MITEKLLIYVKEFEVDKRNVLVVDRNEGHKENYMQEAASWMHYHVMVPVQIANITERIYYRTLP